VEQHEQSAVQGEGELSQSSDEGTAQQGGATASRDDDGWRCSPGSHGRRIGGGNGAPRDSFQWRPAGAGSIPVRVGLDRTWRSTAKVEDKAEQALARGIGARCDGDGRGAGCAIARLELEEGGEGEGEYGSSEGDKAGDDNCG